MTTAVRIKVVYLAQNLTVGGAEELLLGVATHLPRDRFEVVVGCLTREGPIAQELRHAGVRVELLPGEPGPRYPGAFVRLLRFIRAERPDVVHTFLLNAGLYGRLAAWLARVPAIFHAEQNVYLRKPRRHLLLERFLAARTSGVIACCRAVAEFYQRQLGLDGRHIEIIYNAVDFAGLEPSGCRSASRAELGFTREDIVLGCLGRLTEQKGQDVLLLALAQLKDELPGLKTFVAGQGPAEHRLATDVTTLGLTDRVRFLGVRRERNTLYAAMDIFVLPSRWEGLSLALVEAAGLGLPIVATDVGGNSEVVQAGPGVWLLPPDDASRLARAIAAAVTAVQDDPASELRQRCLRPLVRDRFSLGRHLELLEATYRRALNLPTLRSITV
jgi:glycosyltransferase involved in cell wall biosynthesis